MKKKILFSLMALFMLSLTFTSCGDDDDDDNGASIVGKWKETSYVWYEDDSNTPQTDEKYTAGDEIEFKSDGTYVQYGDTGKWSINGNKLTLNYKDGSKDESEEYIITINGNTLIMTSEYYDEEDGHKYKDVYTYTKQ
jgi:hypothetical protein